MAKLKLTNAQKTGIDRILSLSRRKQTLLLEAPKDLLKNKSLNAPK